MNTAATVLVAQPEVNAAATAPFAAVGAMPGAAQYARRTYLKSRRTCPAARHSCGQADFRCVSTERVILNPPMRLRAVVWTLVPILVASTNRKRFHRSIAPRHGGMP